MTGVWFTADTHFQHARIAEIRGFSSAEEHDEAVIRNWNRFVKPTDTVWHLGDVAMKVNLDLWPLINRLNGTIHLVMGNHDPVSPIHRDAYKHFILWSNVFESLQAYARRRIDRQDVLLSHYPYSGDHTTLERYTQYRLPNEGRWLLHGHTHSPSTGEGRQIHVGIDAWDLSPVSIDAIVARMRGES